jgi:phage terminase large subunit
MPSLAEMGARLLRWRENPRAFAYEELKFETGDEWQDKVLEVFPSQDPGKLRISLQACTGPGKTALLAVCNLNFISCYGSRGEHPQGLCTSITAENLSGNLWKELAKWQARSDYLGHAFRWTATRFSSIDFPATWFLEARHWSKKADKETMGRALSGLHARDVMITIDESGDVPVPILHSGEQIFSSSYRWAKLLQGGNPTSLEGALYHAAVLARRLWHVIVVTGDPDDVNCAERVNKENNREQIKLYGRENPWVKATILGQFPASSIMALLGVEDVQAAMQRHLKPEAYTWAQKRLGVDVARGGDDRTVIFPRQGLAAFKPKILRLKRDQSVSTIIADHVMGAKAKWGSELEFFDATGGWAAGAVDVMRANGLSPVDVQFAAPAMAPRYFNRRAEIWFKMALWVPSAALPPLPELVPELVTPTYTFHKGQFQLEEKDQIKKRLGVSPDLADALALTFGMEDMPAGIRAGQQRQPGRARRDADPWEETPQAGTGQAARDGDPFD